MKRIIIQTRVMLSALLLLAIIGTGCKKENLIPIPQTALSDATSFSSPQRIAQQVFGVYSAAKSGQFLGGRAMIYQDVRGEDWINVTTNGVTALGVWNFSITEGDNQVENYWAAGYAAINRANVVLEGIDANASVIPATLATKYKAEVRFIRALSYFYLQSLYARRPFNADNGASLSIPLRLTANKGSAGASLARATQTAVFSQILEDLNFAEQNLPATYGAAAGDSNVVRAHKNAAVAMKMRVYMHMNRWSDVITEGNKIVSTTTPFQSTSNINHRLAATALAPFRTPYTSTENIFSMPMNVTNSPGTQNGLGGYWTNEFGLNSAGILGSTLFPATDARRTNFLTPAAGTTPARWTKFNDDLNNYVPVIRYAEVLLNLAEALARQAANPAVDSRAVALLNAVRNRADASVSWAPATKTELIDAILLERRIELLGEGFRSLDIMRLGIDFPAKASVSSVSSTSLSYVWPIPATELQLNSLMVRNN
ncbi:MAG: RagB/SusD family nutrient uptake outer membrane protein [Sphingomonadales bacterium]|nr:RagB/SusD family nutrient uptake outer membrane protein [Sphingomonadales bacterium]